MHSHSLRFCTSVTPHLCRKCAPTATVPDNSLLFLSSHVQTSKIFKHNKVCVLFLFSAHHLDMIWESVHLCLHDLLLASLSVVGGSCGTLRLLLSLWEEMNHTLFIVCHVVDGRNEAIYLRYHFLQQVNLRDCQKRF